MALRKDNKTGRWHASLGSGKTQSRNRKTFTSKAEAEAWLMEHKLKHQAEQDQTTQYNQDTPLRVLIEEYISQMRDCTNKYRRDCRVRIERMCSELDLKTLSDVTQQNIEPFKQQSLSTTTLNRYLGALKTMLNYFERIGKIEANPIRLLKPWRGRTSTRRALSESECHELLRSAKLNSPKDFYPIIATFLMLGLRKSELVTLEWTDVDFKRDTVQVIDKPHIEIAGEPHRCKWNSSRVLPLRPGLKKIFQEMERTSNFIFPTKHGNFRFQNFARDFRRAISKAKVYKLEEITPHYLRHTFISQLLVYGKQDIKTVSYLAGHKNLKTTQGYSHLLGGKEELMEAVSSIPDYV